jgi:hypothetical protein
MAKYQARYAKNYATYQRYLMTHNGIPPFSAGQGIGYNPYQSGYQGYAGSGYQGYPGSGYQGYPGAYPYPTQQLSGSPILGLLSPFLGNYSGLQNYGGGYYGGGYNGVVPLPQPPYVGASYPAGPQYGEDDDDDGFEGHHHHHFDDGGYGGYGPYSGGGYGPYGGGGYGPYGSTPGWQGFRHHHFDRDSGVVPRFAGQRFFGGNPAAGHGHAWASRPVAFTGGGKRWGRNH